MKESKNCAICGKENTERAHVKDRAEFGLKEDDKRNNIIHLCRNHHDMFDRGKIGICPNQELFVLKEGGEIYTEDPIRRIDHIKDEYIDFKNSNCDPKLRFRMGLEDVPWANSVCEEG
jgi:predicted restriction endonuclease